MLVQKNKYAGVMRNNGMQHAVGKYLSFLDADDYFEPDMLEYPEKYQKILASILKKGGNTE